MGEELKQFKESIDVKSKMSISEIITYFSDKYGKKINEINEEDIEKGDKQLFSKYQTTKEEWAKKRKNKNAA